MTGQPRERPILFSGRMVRAMLEDRKTQTRRVITRLRDPDAARFLGERDGVFDFGHSIPDDPAPIGLRCPFGDPGDLLYVRETWQEITECGHIAYRASCEDDELDVAFRDGVQRIKVEEWRPSLYMPKSVARIWLRVESRRPQRLQDISRADCFAEGIEILSDDILFSGPARQSFRTLWDSINKTRGYGWDLNPWVLAVTFSVQSTTGRENIGAGGRRSRERS